MNNFKASFISSIKQLDREKYQQLIDTDYPFIQYNFLEALESTNAVGEASGWKPCHLIIKNNNTLIAFLPLYLKAHSYGEYVFDFEWAKAYQAHGLNYYPKLVTAIPFTPVTGVRLCHLTEYTTEQLLPFIANEIRSYANSLGASSWHYLFADKKLSKNLNKIGLLQRNGVQFHWFNKSYKNFDHFLNRMTSKRRKDIRRERKKVSVQEIALTILEGQQINDTLWSSFHQFYQLTYAKRSGHGGYLSASFFKTIGDSMSENLILIAAFDGDDIVAAALFFKDQNTLYGRYWGCKREYDFLHFEACYYQGIEYCIKHNLQRFDAGAQGEHKIQRGFEAVQTCSSHWIADNGFSQGINYFLQQEKLYTKSYLVTVKEKSPFKKLT